MGHGVKLGGLGIPEPLLSAECDFNTSKAASRELVDSLLGGYVFNYVGYRVCVHKASRAPRRAKVHINLGKVARRKELAGAQESNCLHRATMLGVWLSALPHRLNITQLSWEEFRDNIRLRYGLMPQDIPATCNGCGKKLSIEHVLLCPTGGLVQAQNDDASKEWGALEAHDALPISVCKVNHNHRKLEGCPVASAHI